MIEKFEQGTAGQGATRQLKTLAINRGRVGFHQLQVISRFWRFALPQPQILGQLAQSFFNQRQQVRKVVHEEVGMHQLVRGDCSKLLTREAGHNLNSLHRALSRLPVSGHAVVARQTNRRGRIRLGGIAFHGSVIHQAQRGNDAPQARAEVGHERAHLFEDAFSHAQLVNRGAPAQIAHLTTVGVARSAAGQRLADGAVTAKTAGQAAGVRSAVGVAPGVRLILALEDFPADRTALAEQLPEVIFAVGLTVVLMKGAPFDRFTTARAQEMFGVPGLALGGRERADDGPAAASATRAETVVVASRVVSPGIMHQVAHLPNRLSTACAAETVGVPGLVKRSRVALSDRFFAAGTG